MAMNDDPTEDLEAAVAVALPWLQQRLETGPASGRAASSGGFSGAGPLFDRRQPLSGPGHCLHAP